MNWQKWRILFQLLSDTFIHLSEPYGCSTNFSSHTKLNERFPRPHNWAWTALKGFHLGSCNCTNAAKLIAATTSEISFTNSTT